MVGVQLFNDAIIVLLLSRFTPPFVGFDKIRTNRKYGESGKKKLGVSEITVESGFSLVVLNAIQDLQGCSCNRVVVRCSFLLSMLLAPSGVGIWKYVNWFTMREFFAPGPFLQTWSKNFLV